MDARRFLCLLLAGLITGLPVATADPESEETTTPGPEPSGTEPEPAQDDSAELVRAIQAAAAESGVELPVEVVEAMAAQAIEDTEAAGQDPALCRPAVEATLPFYGVHIGETRDASLNTEFLYEFLVTFVRTEVDPVTGELLGQTIADKAPETLPVNVHATWTETWREYEPLPRHTILSLGAGLPLVEQDLGYVALVCDSTVEIAEAQAVPECPPEFDECAVCVCAWVLYETGWQDWYIDVATLDVQLIEGSSTVQTWEDMNAYRVAPQTILNRIGDELRSMDVVREILDAVDGLLPDVPDESDDDEGSDEQPKPPVPEILEPAADDVEPSTFARSPPSTPWSALAAAMAGVIVILAGFVAFRGRP